MIKRCSLVALLLAALAAMFAAPAIAAGERSIGVSAASFEFSAAAGEAGEGEVWISNEGEGPVTVRVYAADQVVDEAGGVTYVTPTLDANPLQSPASWMTVTLPPDARSLGNIPFVALDSAERVKVSFRVDIPQGAVPGDHNILLFAEMFDPDASTDGGQARVFGRLGTRVRARVEGEIIEDVQVSSFAMPAYVLGSTVPYEFTVANKGNVDERATLQLVELDSSGAEKASSTLSTDTALFAGKTLRREGEAESETTFGKTTYKLEVSYPSQTEGANGLVKTIEEERAVWVVPAWLPYALGALLLVLLGSALWAAGRRSVTRRAAREQSVAAADREGVA